MPLPRSSISPAMRAGADMTSLPSATREIDAVVGDQERRPAAIAPGVEQLQRQQRLAGAGAAAQHHAEPVEHQPGTVDVDHVDLRSRVTVSGNPSSFRGHACFFARGRRTVN